MVVVLLFLRGFTEAFSRILIFWMFILTLSLRADNFSLYDSGLRESTKGSELVFFVTSNFMPIDNSFVRRTIYGKMLSFPRSVLDSLRERPLISSRGMYSAGNYVSVMSVDSCIRYYRYSKKDFSLHLGTASSFYDVRHFGSDFYYVDPFPEKLDGCFLVIVRGFETRKQSKYELVLDLNKVPQEGEERLVIECSGSS